MIDHLFVHLDVPGADPRLVGEIHFTAKGGRLVATAFDYATTYLAWDEAFPVDPGLGLFTGAQYVAGLPGAMRDCAPDRWGRNLITKARRSAALTEGRTAQALTDADFLVEASDLTRQGALRFRDQQDGPFLGEGTKVPELVELPRLLQAAESAGDHEDFAAIKALLAAGTGSLGGARPKAAVRDGERLLIAKFPHPNDEWDVMAWEKTVLDLAEAAAITVPRTRLMRIADRSVLLLERFDRIDRVRVPYISAMTLLGSQDGDSHDYLEVAEALPEVSAATRVDLNELWRRIVFSVLVNNTDDHLRNHGFLHVRGGWRLSPAFDVNPNPDEGATRQTGIGGGYDRQGALDTLRQCATEFDLTPTGASQILGEVSSAVSGWREAASRNHIDAQELDQFADAFWLAT